MYEPLPVDEIVDLVERALGERDWRVELVAQSSNYVYRCAGADVTVAVRTPRVRMDSPSHYWRQMREVFGLTFPPTEAQLRAVAAEVSAAGVPCPQVLVAEVDGARPLLITTWVTGDSWEPDRFPSSPAVHRHLGAFLAMMHERSRAGFGTVGMPLRPASQYYGATIASAQKTVEMAWTGAGDLLLSVMAECDPTAVTSSFAMVMPDISANQFLFDDAGIAAVVDLDSYVIGPVELELTIAEWCLVDHAAFADGYRSVRPLPRFERFRSFHRATMLVNEESVAGDVKRLLEDNAYFD